MKDGMEYAEMLGINVSSCDVVVKPAKRKKKKDVKEDVITKVNERDYVEDVVKDEGKLDGFEDVTPNCCQATSKKRGFDVIKFQGVAIFA